MIDIEQKTVVGCCVCGSPANKSWYAMQIPWGEDFLLEEIEPYKISGKVMCHECYHVWQNTSRKLGRRMGAEEFLMWMLGKFVKRPPKKWPEDIDKMTIASLSGEISADFYELIQRAVAGGDLKVTCQGCGSPYCSEPGAWRND